VLLAGLFHETHTFLSGTMGLADFDERVGNELWSAEGDGSPLGGALEIARAEGWQVIPAIDLRATPGPTVADEVVDRFWSVLEETARKEASQGFDGVYLVLHGAMVSESWRDVEGELLERLRKLIGSDTPVCGVLDLHGNITAKMATNSHGLIAYRQNPHADACEAARDGARLLARLMKTGERPVTIWERPPLMWPPTGTGTANEPMRTLEAMARQIESVHEEILAVNVFGGFSFADTPDTGVSFTAITLGEPRYTVAELEQLSDWATEHREEGNVLESPLEPILTDLARELSAGGPARKGPVVISEPSDNIGGGAPGDGIGLLKGLIEHQITNCAVAIWDPQAVAVVSKLPVGGRTTVAIGGKGSPLSGPPLQLEVELVSTSDGRFQLEDIHSHLASMSGLQIEMGDCAVVKHAGVTILLTSRRTPPFDLGQWRSQGIIPEQLSVIGVKAAVAHRRVYDPIASAHFAVETPGPCSSNLRTFPFRHVKRPIFPLDKVE